MNEFLQHFLTTLAKDEHAVIVVEGAGWHTSYDLAASFNLSPLR
jgi:hypothetical protein